jgi:hypothetical protein
MYRTICTQLWTDKNIQALSIQGKLLFVYLITNPHTHLSGIYYLPQELIRKETGLSDTLCNTLLDTLSECERAHYDPETSTVFVVNMFEYQGKGPKNEKSAAKQLETLHHTRLIPLFLKRYPAVESFCPDTLLIPYRYPIPSCPSVPDPVLLTSSPNPSSNPKSNGSAKLSKGKRAISEDDKPTEKHFSFGASLKLDVGPEWGKFKNYCLAHDKRYANFEAAFRNWLANADNMKGARHG